MPLTLNLSTCCRSTGADDGRGLIDMLAGFDIQGLELDYRIHEDILPELRTALIDHHIPVPSIHNYFPIPVSMTRQHGSGDLYRLMSPDEEERQQAVTGTKRTIRYAEKLGAKAVVLHCGAVPMSTDLERLYGLYRKGRIDTAKARKFIGEKLTTLKEQKAPYLEGLKRSLEQLLPAAEAASIRLGLEKSVSLSRVARLYGFSVSF